MGFPQETRDYEIFASHNGYIDSMDPMDPRKTPRLVLRFNAPNNGEGDSVAKNPRIRLLKGLENPRKQRATTKQLVAYRNSTRGWPRCDGKRWKNGFGRMFHCPSSTAADRRSKISSPFMRLAPLATPLKPRGNTSRLQQT